MDAGARGTGETPVAPSIPKATRGDKSSAPLLPAPASDTGGIPQTPLPDQTSFHAPRSQCSARPTILIPQEPPASSRTRRAPSTADREKRNLERSQSPPIAARLFRPRPS